MFRLTTPRHDIRNSTAGAVPQPPAIPSGLPDEPHAGNPQPGDRPGEPQPGDQPGDQPGAAALLDRWLRLAELQRRGSDALAAEILAASSDIETSTIDLSDRFQGLAMTAQAQVARVDQVVAIARSIDVNGEAVVLEEAASFVQSVLGKVIDTILLVSKNAMRMVYALDDVSKHVDEAERCLSRIAEVTRQTRYLALNATIEASRTQVGNGGAFQVIATEIRQLSAASNEISDLVHQQIHAVAHGVREGHRVLQEIATTDMTEHILAKDRLDGLMNGMMLQNRTFTAVLGDAVDASQHLSAVIGGLVSGIQFQDRTKQRLDHVVNTLAAFGQESETLAAATRAGVATAAPPGSLDEAALSRVLQGVTLGAARQRFVAWLGVAAGVDPEPAEPANDAGDVEFF